MNEPFNIDEDGMFYDVPPTPPHTLTDERAGYGEPSEAALEAAGNFIYVEWDSGAPPDDPEEYDSLNFYVGDMGVLFDDNDEARDWHTKLTTDLAKRFDAFAAQAVEAALNHAQYIHILESDDKADKAVEAREAEIVAALERYLAGCHKSQEMARQIGYLESAARYDTEIAAYETTIAVVKREL